MGISATLVRALAAIPVAPFRLPRSVVESIFELRRRGAGLRRRSVRVGRFEIPYLEGGASDGPTVLFIHGFSDSKDSFVEVAQAFVDGHRVVLLDLPGFGEATSPLDFHYDLDAFAGVVAGFCEAIGLSEFHVVGSSLGGAVAVQLTLDHPAWIRSVTLVGAAGLRMPTPSLLQRRLDEGDNPFVAHTVEEHGAFMQLVLERQPPIPGPIRLHMADEFIARAGLNEKIMADLLVGDQDLTPRLPEIDVDTLVLWGDCDRVIDISAGRVYRDEVAKARMLIFHGIGHCPQYEAPARTGRYIRRFLDDISAPASGDAEGGAEPISDASVLSSVG